MITIKYFVFWHEDEEIKEECSCFVKSVIGAPDSIQIVKEDDTDPESCYVLLFDFKSKTMNDFEHWFDLLDFAMQFEIHCAVYDHKSKVAKISGYDEGLDWYEDKNLEFIDFCSV